MQEWIQHAQDLVAVLTFVATLDAIYNTIRPCPATQPLLLGDDSMAAPPGIARSRIRFSA